MSESNNFNETFIQEAEELLADVEDCVLDIENDPGNMDSLNRLFRTMHTIKGSGAMFGFDEVASFTHHVETALDAAREGEIEISRELMDIILAARDIIGAMLVEAQGGPAVKVSTRREIVARVEAILPRSRKKADSSKEPDKKEVVAKKQNNWRVRFRPHENLFQMGMDPAILLDDLRQLGQAEITPRLDKLPKLEDLQPENCHLSWDIILSTKEDENAIMDVFIFVDGDCDIDIQPIDDPGEDEELPKLGEILVERGDADAETVKQALGSQTRVGDLLKKDGKVAPDAIESAAREQKFLRNQQQKVRQETVRVPADRLDKLVNLVGELVITQAQLARSASDYEDLELGATVEEVERLTGELRDIALNIRMMPIGSTFNRFRRLVRDLSSELGKKIDLVTTGADTELDKTVLDRLADPLVHIIRNSIDHGIEKPELRKQNGKGETGLIHLDATHRGASVLISIEDDGKGLDAERIRALAIERGVIEADAELSDKEIFGLIMEPGFSTAETVTSVSGRGVGMDVVRREIETLRGSIDIQSAPGEGTKITLSLPLTLAIIDGLLVRVGAGEFVVPINMIEECLEINNETLAMDRQRNVLKVRGQLVPFVRMREFFGIRDTYNGLEEAVIVDSGEGRIGIVVDKVIGDHQTVIKSLGKVYEDAEGLSGATILGDGTVALIIDVVSLLRSANVEEKQLLSGQQSRTAEAVH